MLVQLCLIHTIFVAFLFVLFLALAQEDGLSIINPIYKAFFLTVETAGSEHNTRLI